jgi:large subunit ribosomal protein L17
LRSLASNLILTERDSEFDDNAPKVKGRIVTTLAKAKEVRPLVERCITIARRSLTAQREADSLTTDAERLSDEWRDWRGSDRWREWNQAVAPVLAARRRAIKLLGNKQAVQILFDELATRFEDRAGGYTRILKLAHPRLGDAGSQAILEFVGGDHDRVKEEKSEAPSFEDETSDETAESAAEEEAQADPDDDASQASADEEASAESNDDEDGAADDDDAGGEEEEKT